MEVSFAEVVFESAEYLQTVSLRDDLLRIPLGLRLTAEELSREGGEIHLAGFLEGQVVGCLVLTPRGDGSVRMRQVAVREGRQGKGIGKRLVGFAEEVAVARGFSLMVLHGRASVVEFYLKLGYEVVGKEFEEVGIPHFDMQKRLTGNPSNHSFSDH